QLGQNSAAGILLLLPGRIQILAEIAGPIPRLHQFRIERIIQFAREHFLHFGFHGPFPILFSIKLKTPARREPLPCESPFHHSGSCGVASTVFTSSILMNVCLTEVGGFFKGYEIRGFVPSPLGGEGGPNSLIRVDSSWIRAPPAGWSIRPSATGHRAAGWSL